MICDAKILYEKKGILAIFLKKIKYNDKDKKEKDGVVVMGSYSWRSSNSVFYHYFLFKSWQLYTLIIESGSQNLCLLYIY